MKVFPLVSPGSVSPSACATGTLKNLRPGSLAWEGRRHTLAPGSAPALPARVGVGRGALEVLLSPESLRTSIPKESARQPPCPYDSGQICSVSPG